MSEEARKNDERVRLRAYRLWDLEGRPHGHNDQYWQTALAQIRNEEHAAEDVLQVSARTVPAAAV
ncbi:DUF2934 domain-containing protein [Lichenicola sp.]|uniref:DUF2934 domain-containing protein n=1 Tax=Lichenicola sp. TaxID=2804529 RepID=UPI003AFFEAD4